MLYDYHARARITTPLPRHEDTVTEKTPRKKTRGTAGGIILLSESFFKLETAEKETQNVSDPIRSNLIQSPLLHLIFISHPDQFHRKNEKKKGIVVPPRTLLVGVPAPLAMTFLRAPTRANSRPRSQFSKTNPEITAAPTSRALSATEGSVSLS